MGFTALRIKFNEANRVNFTFNARIRDMRHRNPNTLSIPEHLGNQAPDASPACSPHSSPASLHRSSSHCLHHTSNLHNLFLSHSWANDVRGRSTHRRVAILKEELRKLGWSVWFDEDKLLVGDVLDVQLARGISSSDAVCICITKAYCEKVNSGNPHDNVWKEWNFCQAIGKKMIPLIFEEEMRDVKAWPPGIMTMILGNTFYLDASGDDLKDVAVRLSAMLRLLGLRPRSVPDNHSWQLRRRRTPVSWATARALLPRTRTEIRI